MVQELRDGNDQPAVREAAGGLSPTPRGRPSWSGLLRLGLVTIPVKAFPANSATTVSHFHQLHADCGQRIRYEKRCPQHGPVDATAIVRGYPYAPDQHVVVEPEELDRLRPVRDKALVLEQFVAVQQIDPVFFAGRSLYLLPDGVAAQHPYRVVTEAVRESGKGAIGRIVLSAVRHLVLVRAAGGLLTLDVLHYPKQVRPAPTSEAEVAAVAITSEELHLAGQLIHAASAPLDWSRYPDTTAQELAALIEDKIANRPLPEADDEPLAVGQLLDALKRSVADAARKGATPRPSRTRRRATG